MNIKNLLERQRGSFISVGDVLTQLSESSGVAEMDAATVLYRLLFIDNKFDGWLIYSPLYGAAPATQEFQFFAEKYLETVARSGRYQADQQCPDDGETYGFHFDEISGFLAIHENADGAISGHLRALHPQPLDRAAEVEELQAFLVKTQSERDSALRRVAELEAELEFHKSANEWCSHKTKLFSLLPEVIARGRRQSSWPKQVTFVPDLIAAHGLSDAEAKALDAVTRPDELRRK